MLSRIHVIYYADVKTPRKTIGKYIVNVYILYKGIHRHFCEDGKLSNDVTRVHKSSHCHELVSHMLTAITVKLIFVLFDHTLFVYHDSTNSAFHAPLYKSTEKDPEFLYPDLQRQLNDWHFPAEDPENNSTFADAT